MKCVLCDGSTHAFGFYINNSARSICITCFNAIKELKHYAPNPFQNYAVKEGKK